MHCGKIVSFSVILSDFAAFFSKKKLYTNIIIVETLENFKDASLGPKPEAHLANCHPSHQILNIFHGLNVAE